MNGFLLHGEPVSVIPGEKPSHSDWFKTIAKARADLLCQAAAALFDSTGAEVPDDEDEDDEESGDNGEEKEKNLSEDPGSSSNGT